MNSVAADMRSQAEAQSKFRHYIEKPRKILHKARDFYVKIVEDFTQISCLPRSWSGNYSNKSRNDERFKALLAAMDKKFGSEMNLYDESKQQKMENGAMRRSNTSNGLGRIDEDKPCYFEDDMFYARNRSCAAKKNFKYL